MLNSIMHRRSIRKYKSGPVPPESIRTLLEAAMMAPSAHNRQPWHFVVCDDRAVTDALSAEHPYSGMLATAPVCIVVCGQLREGSPLGYWQQDCAAATENLLLAADSIGLGTCWMGVAPMPARMEPVRRILGLPEGVEPFNMIAVGYPDESREVESRYSEDKVHYNKW